MKFLAVQARVVDAIKQVDWQGHALGPAEHWSPALRSSLFTILNSASPKMILWGEELVTFYNDAYVVLTHENPQSGIGASYPHFRPGLWPRVRPSVEAALRGDGSIVEEFKTVRGTDAAPTGGVFQLCFSPVLDEHRNISGVLIDIFDVTARKRTEEILLTENALLNALFSTTPVLIAHATPELKLRYVNAAFSNLLGGRLLVGRRVTEAIPEMVEQGFADQIEAVITTGEPWKGRDVPVVLRNAEGEPRRLYLDFVYHPMHAPDGSIAGILFSGYDVTDRNRAREESERLRHELLHSSRMSAMGTMAVTIAHELNQPLTAAANYLTAAEYLAVRASDDAAGADAMRSARDQVLRAGSIVRRMRSLVECGQARTAEFDVARSVDRAVELVRATGSLDGFAVDVDIEADAGRAMGDDVQIEQVLVNLLRNSAQASARSPRRAIAIAASLDKGMIEVTLRDWGPGLPPERLENLFVPLEETSGGSSGLGVGLSLCRTIVEAHGGKMNGRNCDDGGAMFCFALPAAAED